MNSRFTAYSLKDHGPPRELPVRAVEEAIGAPPPHGDLWLCINRQGVLQAIGVGDWQDRRFVQWNIDTGQCKSVTVSDRDYSLEADPLFGEPAREMYAVGDRRNVVCWDSGGLSVHDEASQLTAYLRVPEASSLQSAGFSPDDRQAVCVFQSATVAAILDLASTRWLVRLRVPSELHGTGGLSRFADDGRRVVLQGETDYENERRLFVVYDLSHLTSQP